jgi:Recombinase zinc beta ribbon domain
LAQGSAREPLIDDDLWFRVQDALAGNARPKSGIRSGASLLLQVGFCGYCGGALHKFGNRFPDGKDYRYYQCENRRVERWGTPQKCVKLGSVPRDDLNDAVAGRLSGTAGMRWMTSSVTHT